MGAGIAASPHCAERRICRNSLSGPRGTRQRTSAHQLRRRFPSATPSEEEPDRSTESRRPKARISFEQILPGPKAKAGRCSAALLGMISTASRFASTGPKAGFSRVARSEDHLFRRLVPAGLETLPREPLIACRGDRTFGHLPHRLAVAGSLVRPGPPSRSLEHHAHLFRVAKAKNLGASLWITGISGTTVGTFFPSISRPGSGDAPATPPVGA